MHVRYAVFAAFVLVLLLPAAPAGARVHDTVHRPRLPIAHACGAPAVIAHRGAPALAPENTLRGVDAAVRAGADWVEADIRTTSDDRQVVMHDATVDRTTDGTGRVSRMTASEVAALRVDIGPGGPAPVPTLADVLRRMRGTGAGLLLDVKGRQSRADIGAIVRAAAESGVHAVLGSRTPRHLEHARALDSRLPMDFVVGADDPPEHLDDLAGRVPVRGVSLSFELADETRVAAEHAAGRNVYAWTIDTPADWRTAAALGADAIITDRVREAVRWVRTERCGDAADHATRV